MVTEYELANAARHREKRSKQAEIELKRRIKLDARKRKQKRGLESSPSSQAIVAARNKRLKG
mgnify:FL=1